MEKELSHLDEAGNARMVDVSGKREQLRMATASGEIRLAARTVQLIRDNLLKKGDVLTVAEIAGIQAAKQTAALIPLCHPLLLNQVVVKASLLKRTIRIESEVRCTGPTGVEMEALTAVSVALLTVYDMCKAVDKEMMLGEIRLEKKTKTDPA